MVYTALEIINKHCIMCFEYALYNVYIFIHNNCVSFSAVCITVSLIAVQQYILIYILKKDNNALKYSCCNIHCFMLKDKYYRVIIYKAHIDLLVVFLQSHIKDIPQIFDAVFECTLDMINKVRYIFCCDLCVQHISTYIDIYSLQISCHNEAMVVISTTFY